MKWFDVSVTKSFWRKGRKNHPLHHLSIEMLMWQPKFLVIISCLVTGLAVRDPTMHLERFYSDSRRNGCALVSFVPTFHPRSICPWEEGMRKISGKLANAVKCRGGQVYNFLSFSIIFILPAEKLSDQVLFTSWEFPLRSHVSSISRIPYRPLAKLMESVCMSSCVSCCQSERFIQDWNRNYSLLGSSFVCLVSPFVQRSCKVCPLVRVHLLFAFRSIFSIANKWAKSFGSNHKWRIFHCQWLWRGRCHTHTHAKETQSHNRIRNNIADKFSCYLCKSERFVILANFFFAFNRFRHCCALVDFEVSMKKTTFWIRIHSADKQKKRWPIYWGYPAVKSWRDDITYPITNICGFIGERPGYIHPNGKYNKYLFAKIMVFVSNGYKTKWENV